MSDFKKFLFSLIFLILPIKVIQPMQEVTENTCALKEIVPSLQARKKAEFNNLYVEVMKFVNSNQDPAFLPALVLATTNFHEEAIYYTGTDLVANAIRREMLRKSLENFVKNKKNKIMKKLERERERKLNEPHLSYYLSTGKSCLKSPPFSGWQPFFPDIYYDVKNKRSSRWYPFFSQYNVI